MQRARRALGLRAVGHTGTLDPFASGLLVLLLGGATRVARFLDGLPKTYLAVAHLGIQTDTDDRTGAAVGEPRDVSRLAPDVVRASVAALAGRHTQRPPAYSAKQVAGVRSYRRARRGEAVELPEVAVTVHAAELLELAGERLTFRVAVSTGTYVRALARDLGERLGVGAHLAELRREAIGGLRVEQAVPLERLGPDTPLVPLAGVLAHLPAVALTDAERDDVRHGRPLMDRWSDGPIDHEAVVLLAEGEVVGVGRVDHGCVRPRVVLEGA